MFSTPFPPELPLLLATTTGYFALPTAAPTFYFLSPPHSASTLFSALGLWVFGSLGPFGSSGSLLGSLDSLGLLLSSLIPI